MTSSYNVYEVRPRRDKRGVNLIPDALPFGVSAGGACRKREGMVRPVKRDVE